MALSPYVNARFVTRLAGMAFTAEVQCESIAQLAQRCRENETYVATAGHVADIELIAAEICFDLSRPGGGCMTLDEDSDALLATVLGSLKVGAQHFYNERLGSYDRFNNRITPADLGLVFPDGTLRVVWHQEGAALDFDATLEVLTGALTMLLALQEMPYGSQTEAELDDGDVESAKNRRIQALFDAGVWPDTSDAFEPMGESDLAALLEDYRTKPVPVATAA